MSDWNPDMSKAPKGGEKVDLWGVNLLTHDKRCQRIVDVDYGRVTDFLGHERLDWRHGRGDDFQPTHWMLVAAPPEVTP